MQIGWHAVHHADEVWTHLQGSPLSLWTLQPEGGEAEQTVLSLHQPVHTVPAGHWMAARAEGQYSLVSCCVGPGFDFGDFEMLRDRPSDQHPAGALNALIWLSYAHASEGIPLGSSFGTLFRISTFGESHGGGVGVILEGCPPRLEISRDAIQAELDRRKPGHRIRLHARKRIRWKFSVASWMA